MNSGAPPLAGLLRIPFEIHQKKGVSQHTVGGQNLNRSSWNGYIVGNPVMNQVLGGCCLSYLDSQKDTSKLGGRFFPARWAVSI